MLVWCCFGSILFWQKRVSEQNSKEPQHVFHLFFIFPFFISLNSSSFEMGFLIFYLLPFLSPHHHLHHHRLTLFCCCCLALLSPVVVSSFLFIFFVHILGLFFPSIVSYYFFSGFLLLFNAFSVFSIFGFLVIKRRTHRITSIYRSDVYGGGGEGEAPDDRESWHREEEWKDTLENERKKMNVKNQKKDVERTQAEHSSTSTVIKQVGVRRELTRRAPSTAIRCFRQQAQKWSYNYQNDMCYVLNDF